MNEIDTSTQRKSADRLQLLWDALELIIDPDITDDERWDNIKELLQDNPLLNMTREDEVMLIGEENQEWRCMDCLHVWRTQGPLKPRQCLKCGGTTHIVKA